MNTYTVFLKPACVLAMMAVAGCAASAPPAPTSQEELARRLEQRLSVDFRNAPISQAISSLARQANVCVAHDNRAFVDPGDPGAPDAPARLPSSRVTLRLRNARLKHVLNWLCRFHGLGYAVKGRTVVIRRPEDLPGPDLARFVYHDSEDAELCEALDNRPVSLSFTAASPDEVADVLRRRTGFNFILRGNNPYLSKLRLTGRFRDVPLRKVLDRTFGTIGASYTAADGAVCISWSEEIARINGSRVPPPDAEAMKHLNAVLQEPVSFQFIGTPLADALAFLHSLKKVSILVNLQGFKEDTDLDVTLAASELPLKEALDRVFRLVNLGWVARDGLIYVASNARLADLDSRSAVVVNPREWRRFADFLNQRASFVAVQDAVKGQSKAAHPAAPRVAISSRARPVIEGPEPILLLNPEDKMKLSTALTWICRLVNLAWTIEGGAIFISTPEDLHATRRREPEGEL